MKWYEKNPTKLEKEKEYKKIHIDSENSYDLNYGFLKDGQFFYNYLINYKESKFNALCLYPHQYPFKRIEVLLCKITDDSKTKFEIFNEGFHNTLGQLCLFGHNPDEWSSNYGIKEIIERVQLWFEKRTI